MNYSQSEKITVVIPVYNIEKYVARCIESVVSQTYENLEIIIVNDGSTDTSGDICSFYSKQDHRIVLINQENQGLSMARNNAIDIATGVYVGFVDGDDWIESDMFSTLYDNALNYDADISQCSYLHIHESEKLDKNILDSDNDSITILQNPFDKIADLVYNSNNVVWNKLYKRHLFDNIRFPKRKIFEDIFIAHKLIDKANIIVKSPKRKYYYLQREGSLNNSSFNLGSINLVEAFIERYEYIKEKYHDDNLDKVCRKNIFLNLLQIINSAYINIKMEEYNDEIKTLINSVKIYKFDDCGLSHGEINVLKLIFTNINAYIFAMKNIEMRKNKDI